MADTDYSIEEWRDIPGFEGYYQVSSHGRVRSLDRVSIVARDGRMDTFRKKGKILSPGLSVGYPSVQLMIPSGKKRGKVHKFVCLAFHGPRPLGHEVLHGDGTRTNNHYKNLRWGTRAENIADAQAHGSIPIRKPLPGKARGEDQYLSKLKEADVLEIRAAYAAGERIASLAKRYGVFWNTMNCVVKRRTWAHVKEPDVGQE